MSTTFLRSELTVETLASPKHGKTTLKVHVPKRNVLSRSDHPWMVWRCHGIPRVYCFYFYLEPKVRKDTWMRTASVTVMVTFFESGILKVTWSQLCSFSSQLCSYLITPMITNSPFSTITRHIDNSILKDTLQLYILRTWINMRAKSFIKTSVNVTETRINESAWKKIGTQI